MRNIAAALSASRMNVSYDKARMLYHGGYISELEWRWFAFFWEWYCFRHTDRQERAWRKLGTEGMERRYARVRALRDRLARSN